MPSQNREGRTTIYGPFTPNGPVLSPNLWCLLGETFLWQVGVHHIVHVRRFELEPAVKKLFNVKEVLLVVVAGQLVIGMLGQVVLIREERPHTPQLQDALSAIHDGQLIPAHEFFATMSSDEFKNGQKNNPPRLREGLNIKNLYFRVLFIFLCSDLVPHLT